MLAGKDDEQKYCMSRRTTKAYCRMVRRTTTTYSIYAIKFVYCCFRDWYKITAYGDCRPLRLVMLHGGMAAV